MNTKLRNDLLLMAEEDKRVLGELINNGELKENEYHPLMRKLHEKNTVRIKGIIGEHGWPGIQLVGKEGSEAAWLIVQHAVLDTEFMTDCLKILKEAVDRNDAEGWCYGYLLDRVLIMQDKLQIYGTQHDIDEHGVAFPLPMEDQDKVDDLRQNIGLEPLSEATKRIQERHNLTIKKNNEILRYT